MWVARDGCRAAATFAAGWLAAALRYGGRRFLRVAAVVLRRSGGDEARREARLRRAQQVPRVHQRIVAAGGREPPRIFGQRIRHFGVVGVRRSRGLALRRYVWPAVAAELSPEDIGDSETRQRRAADKPRAERILRQSYGIALRVIAALCELVAPPRAESHSPASPNSLACRQSGSRRRVAATGMSPNGERVPRSPVANLARARPPGPAPVICARSLRRLFGKHARCPRRHKPR